MTNHRDAWEGLPGYEVSYQLPHFSSVEYSHVGEITDVIRGWLQSETMAQRHVKFGQSPELFNFGEAKFHRQNTWEASCSEPIVQGRTLSLVYSVWWYGAKAMHPNQYFETFCFSLNPLTRIGSLEDLFANADKALLVIQNECREQLLAMKFDEMTNDNSELRLEQEYVESGTIKWADFKNFSLREEGIDILFPPYQVAPYAFGPQHAQVSYAQLAPLMRKEMACLLDIEHLQQTTSAWPFGDTTPDASALGQDVA